MPLIDHLVILAISGSLSALAAVLWWIARRLWAKLDAMSTTLATELRAMDVRIARIEAHLWPERNYRRDS